MHKSLDTKVEPRNKESTRHTADFHTFTMDSSALTGSGDQGRRISKRKTTAPARITKDLGYVDKPKASDAVEAEDKSSSDRDGDSSSDEPMGVALGVNRDAALAKRREKLMNKEHCHSSSDDDDDSCEDKQDERDQPKKKTKPPPAKSKTNAQKRKKPPAKEQARKGRSKHAKPDRAKKDGRALQQTLIN